MQNFIRVQGAAIVFAKPDMYSRIVRDTSFCDLDYYAKSPAFVVSRDNPKCFIGWKCGPKK